MAQPVRRQSSSVEQEPLPVVIGPMRLQALLGVPEEPRGAVVFAHGSGSSRLSPRNNHVASALRNAELATLLLDLLTPVEEVDRANVFDIPLLAERLRMARDWIGQDTTLSRLPV